MTIRESAAVATVPKTQVDCLIETIAPAIKGGTDPGVVREQVALLKDLMAMKSKESYDLAMVSLKAQKLTVLKLNRVPGLYDYAALDSIIEQVGDTISGAGFTWDFDTAPSPAGYIAGVCIAKHSGHEERRTVTLPVSAPNRGQDVTKAANGALTACKRVAFKNVFGIVEKGEDKEKAPSGTTRGPGEAPPKGQNAPSASPPEPKGASNPVESAKRALWASLERVAALPSDKAQAVKAAEKWLAVQNILPGVKLADMDVFQLNEARDKVETWIEINKGNR